jgi:NET1-associated nuclear protein 1 (U3 small nucleolar RNA-associated protein 17)
MKIWQWDPASSSWTLNSRIDRPHGIHRVHALTFTPAGTRPFLVSTGGDGNVKVWRITAMSTKKGGQEEGRL